uniref:NADP-dependent oxidoreductase domain-containing protein n=1 Tax=Ananas comosus var. bracteatus TaxID=296719 RepID=A0A6V7QYL6_ANACO
MATERRELGNTGLRLSYVGFGASPFSNVFGRISPAAAVAAVRRTLDLEINFCDTSPSVPLGEVLEAVLGECLREIGAPREDIVVSTKCGLSTAILLFPPHPFPHTPSLRPSRPRANASSSPSHPPLPAPPPRRHQRS